MPLRDIRGGVQQRCFEARARTRANLRILLKRSRAEVVFTTRAITAVITAPACLVRGSFCPEGSLDHARFSGLTAPSSNRSSSCPTILPPSSSLVLSTHLGLLEIAFDRSLAGMRPCSVSTLRSRNRRSVSLDAYPLSSYSVYGMRFVSTIIMKEERWILLLQEDSCMSQYAWK